MERPFDLLKQLRNGVERDAWPEGAQVLGANHKLFGWFHRLPGVEADAQVFVHSFLEGFARTTSFPMQLCAYVVVESESSSHIKRIAWRHHDVGYGSGRSGRAAGMSGGVGGIGSERERGDIVLLREQFTSRAANDARFEPLAEGDALSTVGGRERNPEKVPNSAPTSPKGLVTASGGLCA